jgi:hypothetical protein
MSRRLMAPSRRESKRRRHEHDPIRFSVIAGAGKEGRAQTAAKRDLRVIVICAWCHKIIRPEDGRKPGTSHGICEECRPTVLEKCSERLQEEPSPMGAQDAPKPNRPRG